MGHEYLMTPVSDLTSKTDASILIEASSELSRNGFSIEQISNALQLYLEADLLPRASLYSSVNDGNVMLVVHYGNASERKKVVDLVKLALDRVRIVGDFEEQ